MDLFVFYSEYHKKYEMCGFNANEINGHSFYCLHQLQFINPFNYTLDIDDIFY